MPASFTGTDYESQNAIVGNPYRFIPVEIRSKQWGAWGEDGQRRSKKQNGRIFRGRTWNYEPSGEEVLK
jgi:hypothetical protein